MAIFHLSIKILSRSSGKSAVAAAAYRAGAKLEEKETGYTHDYTRKRGVIYSEIFLPANAPQEYQNREILWNEVQKVEKKSDAQLAREIEVALPVELSREEQITLLQKYIAENFTSRWNVCGYGNSRKACGWENSFAPKSTRPYPVDHQRIQGRRKLGSKGKENLCAG